MKIKLKRGGLVNILEEEKRWWKYPTDEEVSAFIEYTLTAVKEGDWDKIGKTRDKIKELKLERWLTQSEKNALDEELKTLEYFSEEKSGYKNIGQLTRIIVMLLKAMYKQ